MVIEMKEYFEQVPTIRYEGKNSKNPLAFKHYNKDEVIMGKKMSEHLRFAMSYCCLLYTSPSPRDS